MTSPSANGRVPTGARGAAAYYLDHGLIPIPVQPRGKKPALREWEKLRPTAGDLDALFPPDAAWNVGLLLGEPSNGLVDVDLDCPESVAAAPFLLPATGWISGRAGKPKSHYWYLVDDPPRKAKDEFNDLDGTDLLELRSTGGQTVVPPSVHANTGERIVWHTFEEPAHVSLSDLRSAVQATTAAALLARHWPAKGSRHDARLALAGGLMRGGCDEDSAVAFLTAVCTAAGCQDLDDCPAAVRGTAAKLAAGADVRGWPSLIPLLTGDGEQVVRRVRLWLNLRSAPRPDAVPPAPGRAGRQPEPYRPFPVDVLPEPIRSFVVQGARAIGCDPTFLALPALSVAAALIGNTRTIRIKRGWTEPCILWTCIVGESGTLKSPAIHAAAGPVYRLQQELREKFKADVAEYEQAKAVYADRKRAARKDCKEFTEEPPEPPIPQRVVVSDITVEKIASILEDNPRGTLLLRDELAAWFGSFTRYKGKQGGTDVPAWLEMHRAGPVVVDRKTGERPSLFIPRASVCVAGGIQPGTLARCLTADHLEAGLGARILPAWPPRQPKEWREDEIAPEVAQAYESLLRALADLSFGENDRKEREPFALRMTPEAKAAWVAYYNEWAGRQAAVEGATAAVYAKLEGGAARLALLHHVVTRIGVLADDADPIEPESMHAGVVLAKWFAFESQRIYVAMAESEDAGQTRRLIDFIRQHGGRMTARRLHQANKVRYPSADGADAALQTLIVAGLANWTDAVPGPKGGRRTRMLTLKPQATCYESYETDDDPDDDDDEGGGSLATKPATKPPSPCGNPAENKGFVAFVARSTPTGLPPREGPDASDRQGGADPAGEVSEHDLNKDGSSSPPPTPPTPLAPAPGYESYETAPAPSGAEAACAVRQVGEGVFLVSGDGGPGVAAAVEESVVVGLDVETTGLNPRTDRVRLLQLATDRGTYLIECFRTGTDATAPLFEAMAERPVVFHNGVFDLGFLAALGFTPRVVHDTMLLSQLLHGTRRPKGFHGLQQAAERELGRTLNKTEQKGDWSGELTAEQLAYAAADAAVLPDLYADLSAKIKACGLERVAAVESRALPTISWMGQHGVAFHKDAWDALAREAAGQVEALGRRLDDAAPARPGRLMRDDAWNWSSPDQVKEAFAALGVPLESTDDDALAVVAHPLAELLRDFRSAAKLASTYGARWYADALHDGRVYAGWRQIGADSGRMACSSPNLQNLPRDPRYRRCFIAPAGRLLVKADYSQIELRIAAKVADDQAMLDAYGRGDDLHNQTARLVLGVEAPTRAQRQIAKSLNFGLLYGMGAKGLRIYAQSQYGVALTQDEAGQYRRAFFTAYPGLARWHDRVRLARVKESRTLAGRRRLFDAKTPDTQRLNTPVQGTGVDGLKLALALLWERRGECSGAFPVLAVHDEIVVECDAGQADAVKAWLTSAMIDGMAPLLDPVPVEVEAKVSRTWAGD